MPLADGLDRVDPEAGVHTSDTVMRMDELPERMAIIGGGFVAAEFERELEARHASLTRTGEADEERLLNLLRHAHHAEVFRTLARDVDDPTQARRAGVAVGDPHQPPR